jgi:hypothetical protein
VNTSRVALDATARTNSAVAKQRAEHMLLLGVRHVLELCVGPSLEVLEAAYAAVGITVEGNDIDPRWRAYYPAGKWRMGDCLSISYADADAVVFAPPLSQGCTGTRADALCIDGVRPQYTEFLSVWEQRPTEICCLVLPGRTLSTKHDREQFFHLLKTTYRYRYHEAVEMIDGCRKYVDLYCGK